MGLNFHHPGVDHIMPLNSESYLIPYHYSNSVEFPTIVWDLQVCVCVGASIATRIIINVFSRKFFPLYDVRKIPKWRIIRPIHDRLLYQQA